MKKNLLFFFLFSLFISFTACKKENPIPPAEIPAVEQVTYSIDFQETDKAKLKEISDKESTIALTAKVIKTTKGSSNKETLVGAKIPVDVFTITSSDENVAAVLSEGILTVSIAHNDNTEARTGSISISSEGVEPLILEFSQIASFIEWVSIPAGSFMMGSPDDEKDRMGREGPQHKVSLSAFKMSKYPITFDQYDAFCEKTGREKPKDNKWGRGKRPVINISWDDAVAFANWVGEGVRIPTEAEWEYACRAGSTTRFYFGDDKNLLNDYAWNEDNSGEETHPVGQKKPNAWGLYDMHGNVWEWCSDWYDMGTNIELFDKNDPRRYYEKSPENNPKGPEAGELRIRRGGSIFRDYKECRSAVRSSSTPDNSGSDLGIRLVYQKK